MIESLTHQHAGTHYTIFHSAAAPQPSRTPVAVEPTATAPIAMSNADETKSSYGAAWKTYIQTTGFYPEM